MGFLKNRVAILSFGFIALIALLAIFAPWITHYSYEEQNILERLQGPSLQHWMGTDTLGRDLFSRIIYGARMSLAVGIITTLAALVIGTCVGALAGYRGGWVDDLLMRFVDMIYIFPSVLLAILVMIFLGRGFTGILVALSITAWVTQARLVRGQMIQIRELPYIEAARAVGVSPLRLITRHILPNLIGTIIVSMTIQIPTQIMSESFLSFIGLGLQPPYSSWGTLAQEGFRAMQSYPHLILFPGSVLFVTLLAFHFVGEGLQT